MYVKGHILNIFFLSFLGEYEEGTLEIQCLNNFQVDNTSLLTIVIMLCIRSLNLSYIRAILDPLTNRHHSLHLPTPGNQRSTPEQ